MEGEYIPTIIRLILSTDLTLIRLKDSLKFSVFPTGTNHSNKIFNPKQIIQSAPTHKLNKDFSTSDEIECKKKQKSESSNPSKP